MSEWNQGMVVQVMTLAKQNICRSGSSGPIFKHFRHKLSRRQQQWCIDPVREWFQDCAVCGHIPLSALHLV